MKRIGILALAAFAAVALTASAGAGTASAARFIKESGSVVRKGTVSGEEFSVNAIGCYGQTLSGSPSEIFFPTVSNATCTIFGPEAPLKMNGCTFIFHPGAEESAGHFGGTFDIGPAGCGPVTITNPYQCELKVYPKTGLTAHYRNEGTGTTSYVIAELSASGLKQTGKIGICNEYNNEKGTWNATWNLKDYDSGGTQKGVHLSVRGGLYIAGEKSEEESKQPKFESEVFPAAITGAQTSESDFQIGAGNNECETLNLGGSLSELASELTLVPTFNECESLGRPSTFNTNGCHFAFHLANAGSPYTGSLELACEAGHQLEIVVQPSKTLCTISFPAQTLGSVKYTNYGTGASRYVTANASGKGLSYSVSGGNGNCGKEGSQTVGTFVGEMKLNGKEA